MPGQFPLLRLVGTATVTEGGIITLDLPRTYNYKTLYIQVAGSVTVTTAGSSVRQEAPHTLLPRITITADGRNTLHNASAAFYGHASNERYLGRTSSSGAYSAPSGYTAGTYTFDMCIPVDFATPDGIRPKDSEFESRGLQLFQLQMQFATANDLFNGSPVAALGTTTVEIYAAETVELEGTTGDKEITRPIFVKKISMQNVAIPATNSAQEIRLPAGNRIRAVYAATRNAAGELLSGILRRAQLSNGVDVRFSVAGTALRNIGRVQRGSHKSGWHIMDFCSNGPDSALLSNSWNCGGGAEPKLILDVLGSAGYSVDVVTVEIIGG